MTILSLKIINQLIFVTEMLNVFLKVGTEIFNRTWNSSEPPNMVY
jgi:hypothetical protein